MPSLSSHLPALAGGVLIGLASLLAVLATGKIPGISGMFSRLLHPTSGDTAWRVVFFCGLLAGAATAFAVVPAAAAYQPVRSLTAMALAGVLVGFGTRLSGGCTSGYGVCGIGLGSRNAFIATVLFIATGMATVALLDRFGGDFIR